ncbi:Integrase, catalytic core,Ribonuclease H-like domain,Reverse transcriptase domain,Aspartic peptidase [Cinara cedri]|uniref:RNA-directed DNA polymerase n=1 Tax=Cinara cedri TaxID=506608 RepID=A0A5E4N2Y7_9HEMI|nr:Integrase, catalytic core,Ribonuclease H-like domain,Reverse transcriptase domain,Aspartic peptidase [Cinara cedri]
MNQINRIEPINVKLEIEGKPVEMELDTGASVSIISEYEYNRSFRDIKLETNGLKLQYYTKEMVDTLGHIRVNIKRREWLKNMDILSNLCSNKCKQIKPLFNINQNNKGSEVIKRFSEVFSEKLGLYKGEEIELALVEGGKPKFFQPRPLPLVLKPKVEAELERLEKEGIISKVKYSLWGTPIVPVIKPSGDIRIGGDYKVTVNQYLKFEREIVPRIEELLIPNIRVYFDEILIFGDSEEEHFETLTEVIDLIKSLGLTVRKEKCLFFENQIKFLGYIINREGSKQDPEKIKAINLMTYPKDKTQLQAFLGSINYYRQYIPQISTIQAPLSNLLKKDVQFNFNRNCQLALNQIKREIISDRILKHFDPNQVTILTCDASVYGLGVVLSQLDDENKEHPVVFASRTLNSAEKNYSQVDKEALAIIFGVLNASLVQKETNNDPLLSKVKYYISYGWPEKVNKELEVFRHKQELLSLEQNTILWGHRIVISKSIQNKILEELHYNHLGVVKMKLIVRGHLWWLGIDKDIENIASKYDDCNKVRPMPGKTRIHTWEWSQNPWQRLHADFLGPFKGQLFLIIEDAYSKWLEVFKVPVNGAQYSIDIFRNLFARYGLPEYLVTDNGPPFTSVHFQQFLRDNRIGHRTSSPYYPQSNGQVESGVKIIKTFLKKIKLCDSNKRLDQFVFDYRIATHTTTKESLAKLLLSRNLCSRFDILKPNIRLSVSDNQEKQLEGKTLLREFKINEIVLVREYATNMWIREKIKQRVGSVLYLIELGNGTVHKSMTYIDQLIKLKDMNKAKYLDKTED